MNDHDIDEDFSDGSSVPTFVLPFVTAGAALAVGALLGGLVMYLVKPNVVEEKMVPRDLTEAELEAACAPFVIQKDDEVQAVQAEMMTLAKDLKTKNDRVAELEKQLRGGKTGGGSGPSRSALVAELEKAKTELSEVKTQLEEVKAERDQLVDDLKKTIVQLEEAEQRADFEAKQKELYKADALINKWKAFKAQSTVEICDHGGRKKMGKCRESVASVMTDAMWGEFKHCVLAGQAVPSMIEIEKNGTLPTYSRYLGQDNKVTKDWAVMMCDPSLPEADLDHEDQVVSDVAPI